MAAKAVGPGPDEALAIAKAIMEPTAGSQAHKLWQMISEVMLGRDANYLADAWLNALSEPGRKLLSRKFLSTLPFSNVEVSESMNLSLTGLKKHITAYVGQLKAYLERTDSFAGLDDWRVRAMLRTAGIFEVRPITQAEAEALAVGWGRIATHAFNAWLREHDEQERIMLDLLPDSLRGCNWAQPFRCR